MLELEILERSELEILERLKSDILPLTQSWCESSQTWHYSLFNTTIHWKPKQKKTLFSCYCSLEKLPNPAPLLGFGLISNSPIWPTVEKVILRCKSKW